MKLDEDEIFFAEVWVDMRKTVTYHAFPEGAVSLCAPFKGVDLRICWSVIGL